MSEPAKKKKKPPSFTWAQAIRDIVVTSMNKGQLPVLAVSAVVLLIVWRMPSTDMTQLAMRIVERFSDYSLLGWIIALLLVFAWWFHANQTRKEYNLELARIGEQKSAAQQAAANRDIRSSRASR